MGVDKLLAIDGDSLIYKATYATSYYEAGGILYRKKDEAQRRAFELDCDVKSRYVLPHSAEAEIRLRRITNSIIEYAEEHHDIKDYILYLTPSGHEYVTNYKMGINSEIPYKANRMLTPKPKYFRELYIWLIEHYNVQVAQGMEADDLCGIAASNGAIVAAIDKDVLYACPGHKYNFDTKEDFIQTEQDAWYYYFQQVLMGDMADNIQGIYKIGKKTSEKILEGIPKNPNDLYQKVLETYQEYFKGFAPKKVKYSLLHDVCRLLWVHRHHNDTYHHYLSDGVF